MFCTDRFLKEYGSLPRSHLPLVGILLGNDYVHLESSQKLWSEKVVSKEKEIMDTHRRIKKVTSRLRGQTIKSALEEILSTVPRSKKEEVRKLIEYSLRRDWEIQHGKGLSLVTKILDETEHDTSIYSKNNNPLPQWFSTAYRNRNFPSWMLEIICYHKFHHLAQVEKESRPYSLFSAIDIFRAFSAILLSVDYPDISLLGSVSAETIGIELGVRVGSKLEQWTVPFYSNDSQRVPQLRDIPELSFRVRMAFFNDVLKIDETSSDSAETIGIELGVRVGSKLEQWTVPFYNNDSQRVPQLRDIPELSFRVRLAFFNDVLKIDETSSGIVDYFQIISNYLFARDTKELLQRLLVRWICSQW
ncbi:hypothetical protein QYM36_017604 [Artemia franciscana]|uniref:Uncharacterized protein n=1 Tax=Artemia franciscana TaxID=6661 RepID=A0AA88HBQ3_ARTSF|nr:hypothetical protein QYM36_017604 [Artemia franciscana]